MLQIEDIKKEADSYIREIDAVLVSCVRNRIGEGGAGKAIGVPHRQNTLPAANHSRTCKFCVAVHEVIAVCSKE